MKAVIKINGMSCMHCVASVKNALCSLDGVNGAEVSLENGSAEVEYDENKVSPAEMVDAVEDQGFDAEL